jgi:RNA polymerase sigma-70 factor (ECF subfamily)
LDFEGTLIAAQQGDDEAFARLWRAHQPALLRYLTVKSASDADDLAADIWCNVVRALPSFQGNQHGFRSWLFTTARNRLTDWYRGTDRRPVVIETESLLTIPARLSVEGEVTDRSDSDAAVALIATLPPDQSEAVMLRVVVGLDVSHVAAIMGRTPGSVRVLCHRGLKHLERSLDESGDSRAAVAESEIHSEKAALAALASDMRFVPVAQSRLHA